jgi:hypothetical protein
LVPDADAAITREDLAVVDRSIDGRLDRLLRTAIIRARASLTFARRLLAANFPGPAYVWAVRSIEIFVKELMLLPLFLEQTDGDWNTAWIRVRDTFGAGKWNRTVRVIEESYGPLDPMLTETGEEVWSLWKSVIVRYRGDIVHGMADPPADEAEQVVAWADQLITQLTLRLIVAGKHPLHDLFVNAIDAARAERRENDEA